jgi:hypothetical protein
MAKMRRISKLDRINEIASASNGTTLTIEADVPVEDTLVHQQEVLSNEKKAPFKIELKDGKIIELPYEITVRDVLKRRIFEHANATMRLIYFHANRLANTNLRYPSTQSLGLALSNPIVREELESLVARVSFTPREDLEANISEAGVVQVYNWIYSQLYEQNQVPENSKN